MRIVRILVWNTIAGLLALVIANVVAPRIGFPKWAVLVTALGGVPGALLAIILRLLDVLPA